MHSAVRLPSAVRGTVKVSGLNSIATEAMQASQRKRL
jgi:hypothetical protein